MSAHSLMKTAELWGSFFVSTLSIAISTRCTLCVQDGNLIFTNTSAT